MITSRVLAVVGILVLGLGCTALKYKLSGGDYALSDVNVAWFGSTLLLMGLMGWSRRPSARGAHLILWLGVALVLAGWVIWESDHRSEIYKVKYIVLFLIPGLAMMVLGWSKMVMLRAGGTDHPR